ncbi:MAG TPA: response regulator [Candidatus Sulfotelmatobacter sp.]|jgi:two-component system response regulator|nr:response regulator [Candidatus Sulfotelmatobacter sp.]
MNTHVEVEVLLVEDNARDAEMTLRTLRRRNLANNVTHVKDGQEALDWLFGAGTHAGRNAGKPPKVVLLDLKLPKVDGLEVLRAIRSDERTRLTPVVVMTSSREERDVIESYKLGVNSYVVKPMDFERFSAAVAELGHYWLLVNQEPK